MGDFLSNHHRRSIRLAQVDYSVPGFYFVTICTQNRECLFSEVRSGEMKLNDFGKIVKEEWDKTAEIRKNVVVDEFMIMPNHFHGIILITDAAVGDGGRGVLIYAPKSLAVQSLVAPQSTATQSSIVTKLLTTPREGVYQYAPTDERSFRSPSQTVGAIIRGFKSITTARINTIRQTRENPVWQRNYYEHIIRNDESLGQIRQYIRDNPFNWDIDEENVGCKK